MIMKQDELMMAMHTQPDQVHRLLERVTERNIAFMRQLRARLHVDGGIWPYIWLPQEDGVVITEDFMPLLSTEMYAEFGLRYLKRIAEEFGGVFVHCCGSWLHHARSMAESGINYLGIDFCYPYAKIEEIQEFLPGLVLHPSFASHTKSEYEEYPAFVEGMLAKRRGDTTLWFAMDSSEGYQSGRVCELIRRHGVRFEGFWRR